MKKKALITGITGQSGSYLAELLLDKGYEVHGIIRRSSSFNTERIDHIFDKLKLYYGDVTDIYSIEHVIQDVKPDEIYNLAAQSHVAVSFEMPEYTGQVDALGVLRLLEAVRRYSPKSKIYQASTSELFGKVQEIPQKETTPFYPRSPYGVAKLYAYWICKNYREAYGMFISNGILFNHETLAGFIPMIFKEGEDNLIDIKPISEIVKCHTINNKVSIDENLYEYQETEVDKNLYVWDSKGWTKVKFASGYPSGIKENTNPRFIITKNSSYMATRDHVCIMDNGEEKKIGDIKIGDKVNIIEYPKIKKEITNIKSEESELLGFIIGDGYYNKDRNSIKIVGKDSNLLDYYSNIWQKLGGTVYKYQGVSGFNSNEIVWHYTLNGNKNWIKRFDDLYDEYKLKKIPKLILNSNIDIQENFLIGYNNADGLKSNHSKYKFKNFKTNSSTLAAGLLFILKRVTNQEYNINIEKEYSWGESKLYYSLNILSDSDKGQNHRNNFNKYIEIINLLKLGYSQRKINRETGISRNYIKKIQDGYVPDSNHHLKIENNVVKKIIDMDEYDGWFYDLETDSGTFQAGIGQGHIHNSPRRGETFVTKKITHGLANWTKTKIPIHLGNLNAKRDWGYAKDYVYGMWLMLQQDKPEDFILATGESHSNKEFIEEACKYVNIDIEWRGEGINEIGIDKRSGDAIVIQVDPKYFRPSEVDILLGDPTKAKEILGWEAKTKFKDLVKLMMEHDIEKYGKKSLLRKIFKK